MDAKSRLAGPSTAGFAPRDFCTTRLHPIPPSLLHAILYGWTQPRAQPPKNAFLRPPETWTTCTDCLPTLQAGPRYPRGRACPVGWPSAAPIPVDAGHPVWGGSCRRVATLPYKPVCGVRLMKLCARRYFVACLDQSHSKNDFVWGHLHTAARPPKQGARRLRGQAPRTATPSGRLAPGDAWSRPAAWVGHRCWLSVSPEAGRTRFSGVASTHTKLHVKSEGGMGCTRVFQNRVVQTRPGSLPPKAIWRPKPTLKEW